jgi:hypothetical protein
MARANLSISEEIVGAFHAAQESADIRFLKVIIRDESLVLDSSVPRIADAAADFNNLLPESLTDKVASFIIYRFGDNDLKPFHWLLLAWVSRNGHVCNLVYFF